MTAAVDALLRAALARFGALAFTGLRWDAAAFLAGLVLRPFAMSPPRVRSALCAIRAQPKPASLPRSRFGMLSAPCVVKIPPPPRDNARESGVTLPLENVG